MDKPFKGAMNVAPPHVPDGSVPPTVMPSLAIAWWPIEQLRPYEHNPRIVPKAAIEKVADSLREFGFRQPIVLDRSGVIIVGHTRLLAARRLGLTQVPVHIADLTEEQARAYRLADNRTGEETSWDLDLLPAEISALADLGYDLDHLGFDVGELDGLLVRPAGLVDPDELPDPPTEPICRPGDLWALGQHRLLCGDATKAEDVGRLMGGERAPLMATDPPYLVDYQGGAHPASAANKGAATKDKCWDAYIDHEHAVAFYVGFLQAALDHALRHDAAIYQCFAILRTTLIWQAWETVGLLPHQICIWKKSRAVLTYSWFLWDYEALMVGWPAGHQPRRHPPANERAVWEIESTIEDGAAGLHPTQKPVELIRRPIGWHTKPGEIIYEPFCGSGTALIAAEIAGRRCYALELSASFCDVAIERWQRFTGKVAVRHG
jgi:DNA modification methylase